jgi:hypothetical protein
MSDRKNTKIISRPKPASRQGSLTQRHPSRPLLNGKIRHVSGEELEQLLGPSRGDFQVSPLRKKRNPR